jgi:hypothetical protein
LMRRTILRSGKKLSKLGSNTSNAESIWNRFSRSGTHQF